MIKSRQPSVFAILSALMLTPVMVPYGSAETDAHASCGAQEILPGSDDRYISGYDLMGLSLDELKLARNEIYARHGYAFAENGEAATWFATCDWYEAGTTQANAGIGLTPVEAANVKAIQNTEHRRTADMTAVAVIPSSKTPYSAIWTFGEIGSGPAPNTLKYDVLSGDGKLRLTPITAQDAPTTVQENDDGGTTLPPMISLYDFGAYTFGVDVVDGEDRTFDKVSYTPALDFGVRSDASETPYILSPSLLESMNIAITDQEAATYMDETGVTRYSIESGEPPAWREDYLSGDIWVSSDGIMLAASLQGRAEVPGEPDLYKDWSTAWYLTDIVRLDAFDADELKRPELLDDAQWHAPG